MNTPQRTAINHHHFNHQKYAAVPVIRRTQRRWPDHQITTAPQWCSVDLRDGNQALPKPMNTAQKHRLFAQLVKIGFKEIEVGFPAASQPDFDFVRELIEQDLIPDDVTIQVLTQAREDIIARTFESLRGVKRAIVHIYNSTSPAQRRYVFASDRNGVRDIAVQGARHVKQFAEAQPATVWTFQYSPESFTQTEIDFAVEICSAVCDIWRPDQGQPVIINLPATVEVDTPNVYADRLEFFGDNFPYRQHVRLSVHTHNDRGCGVAAAELAVMAGADRVEGTLLGNGERTGNMDIVTMAMNLYSQGVDPQLDFSDIAAIVDCVEACTDITTHVRHPYVGELVYTAFSGSHQDAIRKGLAQWQALSITNEQTWDVPYLPIDPQDVGRNYEAVVRVNSQSGKGGVMFALERETGLALPRALQVEFSREIQQRSEAVGGEVSPAEITEIFRQRYVNRTGPWTLRDYRVETHSSHVLVQAEFDHKDHQADDHVDGAIDGATTAVGEGRGTLEAMVQAISHLTGLQPQIIDYHEHALDSGTTAQAACYLHASFGERDYWSVGIAEDSVRAALAALVGAANTAANHVTR
jgi:2-isopropylmalate synthase